MGYNIELTTEQLLQGRSCRFREASAFETDIRYKGLNYASNPSVESAREHSVQLPLSALVGGGRRFLSHRRHM